MLPQEKADSLMAAEKAFVDSSAVRFPLSGEMLQRELKTLDGRESFLVDVNRKGKIKLTKCTFQERYAVVEVLLRLDIDGPPHENPDGTVLPTPHLHVYKEGYGTKWAYELPADRFSDTSNLPKTFREFLHFCNVEVVPEIQLRIQ
ncbi:MAG TPA: hypothetical protein VL475_02540 [Planctomycetaceae bacterium]|jgi:hypothetical protein|nr:hypothetical protein [Planctomycetaceae bacterium]